jgi:hypothetical protein
MIITNKHSAPPEYVMAVRNSEQRRDYYSPSMLTDPPRKIHLVRRYYDVIEVDAIDRLWSLFGTAVHEKLEKQDAGGQAEVKLVGDFHGFRLQGSSDLYTAEDIIRDWKVTSVYSIIFDPAMEKYKYQLNAYRRLFEQNGYKPKGMEVSAILKDWKKNQVKEDYPKIPLVSIAIEVVPDIDDWIADRIDLFEDTANLFDEDLPYCTAEEKWQDPPKWATMARGKKRAVKLHLSEEDATQHASHVSGGYVEYRPSIPKRCEEYCDAKAVCNQYREEHNGGKEI